MTGDSDLTTLRERAQAALFDVGHAYSDSGSGHSWLFRADQVRALAEGVLALVDLLEASDRGEKLTQKELWHQAEIVSKVRHRLGQGQPESALSDIAVIVGYYLAAPSSAPEPCEFCGDGPCPNDCAAQDEQEPGSARGACSAAGPTGLLGPDLSGRSLAKLLHEAASVCDAAGGGPLADCLRDKAILAESTSARCSMCGGTGWVLDANAAGMTDPVQLELMRCFHPACNVETSVASVNFRWPRFTHVARHPRDGYVMSVSTTGNSVAPEPASKPVVEPIPGSGTAASSGDEAVGKFGHHPDEVIDAEVEVGRLEGLLAEAHGGLLRALDFRTASPEGLAVKADVRDALRRTGRVDGTWGETNTSTSGGSAASPNAPESPRLAAQKEDEPEPSPNDVCANCMHPRSTHNRTYWSALAPGRVSSCGATVTEVRLHGFNSVPCSCSGFRLTVHEPFLDDTAPVPARVSSEAGCPNVGNGDGDHTCDPVPNGDGTATCSACGFVGSWVSRETLRTEVCECGHVQGAHEHGQFRCFVLGGGCGCARFVLPAGVSSEAEPRETETGGDKVSNSGGESE